MKKPSLRKLKVDQSETRRVRSAMAHQKSIKITININADILAKLKSIADDSGVPYQRIINRTLASSLAAQTTEQSRLDKLEQELSILKKKLAA